MCAWKGLLPWTALWKIMVTEHTQPPTQPAGRGPTPSASRTARRPFLWTLTSLSITHRRHLQSITLADLDPSACLDADHLQMRCLDNQKKQQTEVNHAQLKHSVLAFVSLFTLACRHGRECGGLAL